MKSWSFDTKILAGMFICFPIHVDLYIHFHSLHLLRNYCILIISQYWYFADIINADNLFFSQKLMKCEEIIYTHFISGEVIKPIGFTSSLFCHKRGTPRQPTICPHSRATVTLDPRVINNPQYTLEGLEDFSHVW